MKGPLDLDDNDVLENIQTFVLFDTEESSTTLRHKLQYIQQFQPTLVFSNIRRYFFLS